jgi:peptidylprolyl isomerase
LRFRDANHVKQPDDGVVKGGALKIEYPAGAFTADEVVKYLNLSGQGSRIYAAMIRNREVLKKAEALSLRVRDDDLQAYVDRYRSSRGMYSAEKTRDTLQRNGLDIDDLEAFCEASLLAESLKHRLADNAAIQAYFVNNRARFDRARISVIVVEKASLADELVMQVTEDEVDFHSLARHYSIDPNTRYAGGYVGLVPRSALSEDISAKVFNATAGQLLGPFEMNGTYQLVLVEEVIKPELDDRIKDEIREALFMEWLAPLLQEGVQCTPRLHKPHDEQ